MNRAVKAVRWITILVFSFLICLIAIGGTGCASATLPPRLTAIEEARLKDAHIHLTVGVETNDDSAWVIRRLRQTKLFDAVNYVDQLQRPPSVMARFESTPYGTATIPYYTFLTFGIIPTTGPEPYSFGCTFYSPHHPAQKVEVEYIYYSQTTLGWVAALKALSPDTVSVLKEPDEHRRFSQRLSLMILDHYEEIMKLAE